MGERPVNPIAARLGPWLSPIAPTYFIARATQTHLAAPGWIAITIAIAIEATGITATHNTLRAYSHNRSKRKTDPSAPLTLTLLLAGVYLVTGITLTIWVARTLRIRGRIFFERGCKGNEELAESLSAGR